MIKNAILLAGGSGTRLAPLTNCINKHLLNVNGKFVIDYPLATLKQFGVENVSIIMGGEHFSQVVDHCQDGRNHGMHFNYVFQGEARGIAQAINICRRYVADDDRFAVILGDNIYSDPITLYEGEKAATIVVCQHPELQRFGVATFSNDGLIDIEEKPQVLSETFSQYAITGCYFFDQQYFEFFKSIKPSARGEFEVCDIIRQYWQQKELDAVLYGGKLWSDAGTHQSLAYVNDYFYHQQQA
jgi:glucose-1-phosphate thymidylyltransferase